MFIALTNERGEPVYINFANVLYVVKTSPNCKVIALSGYPIMVTEDADEIAKHLRNFNRLMAGFSGLPGTIAG